MKSFLRSIERLRLAWTTSVALLLCALSPVALAEISDNDRQALIDLYEATGGEDWRFNDGWLGEPGTECDWFGVHCQEPEGDFALALSNNQLSGEIPDSLAGADGLRVLLLAYNDLVGTWQVGEGELPRVLEINLKGNRIEALDLAPGSAASLIWLRLSDNELSEVPQGIEGRGSLSLLDLSHNELAGELPSWLSELNLGKLYLAGNTLSGSILPALAAMEEDLEPGNPATVNKGVLLDLRGNAFSGEIPEEATDYAQGFSGWLNLCWNPLEIDNVFVEAWLETEHFGDDVDQCLGASLVAPTLADSGSWFNPDRAGEGFSIMQLDDGQTMVYWFTYAPADDPPRRQSWLAGSRVFDQPGFDLLQVFGPGGGEFASGLPNPSNYVHEAIGDLELVWTEEAGLQSTQQMATAALDEPVTEQMELTQLTQLAGTTCDNQSPFQEYSGAWYDPDRAGEGFVLEVLPNGRALVYWFTYTPGEPEQQAWLIGDGPIDSPVIGTPPPGFPLAVIEIDDMVQPVGTTHGPEFDSGEIDYIDWGSLEIEFYRNGTGRVFWDSQVAGYGSGEYPIERLAKAKLADCE